jgi:hypothetical protein
MADLKTLQKKISTLLYQQLSQYFKQVQILSYKPSGDGKVTGKFVGDRRNYNFVLNNNQLQYLPSTSTKMDAALATGITQCTGSNHPCKGEKGTRCVPDSQSCKQKESSPEGMARVKEISDTSKAITALVAPNKTPSKTPKEEVAKDAPELDKDISLYDFLKYYSPWRPEGSKGFENAKRREVKRKAKAMSQPQSQAATKPEPKAQSKATQPDKSKATQPDKSKGLGSSKKENTPYDFLGINPKDFPSEAALYKAAKVAYRNLAAKYHPDKGGDPKLMIELNNVMDKLKKTRTDSRRRRVYR